MPASCCAAGIFCCLGNCGLCARAVFLLNKLSQLSSIRTTFYYYCLDDYSTWLPKALLALSVKPGLELWALAASLLRRCCGAWSPAAAFSLLFVGGRVQEQPCSGSDIAAVQVVLETFLPGTGVTRRAPLVLEVLPVKKGSVGAAVWGENPACQAHPSWTGRPGLWDASLSFSTRGSHEWQSTYSGCLAFGGRKQFLLCHA